MTASSAPELDELITRCGRRDQAALRRLYEEVGPQLFAVALRILRRRDLAEDAVHEAFVQIWRRAPSFDRSRGEAKAWMVAIVRYRALDMVRRLGREQPGAEPALADTADPAPDALSRLALARDVERLYRCLDRLEERPKRCIVLAYIDGYSHNEIAGRLGVPIGTVKSWVHRGLAALRRCLES